MILKHKSQCDKINTLLALLSRFISSSISSRAINYGHIDVHYKEVVPHSLYTLENSTVTFYCGSSSPVRWTFLDHRSEDVRQLLLEKHQQGPKQITFNNAGVSDSGLYYCNGTYGSENFSIQFNLNVYKSTQKAMLVPNWVEVVAGGSITLSCGSDAPVEWFSRYMLYQDKVAQNNALTLFNLYRKHSGKYVCRGILKLITLTMVFHRTAIVYVNSTVRILPAI